MKNSVLLLFIVFLYNVSLAQNWYPNGATWTFNLQEFGLTAHGYVKYSVGNDTLINDTIAKIINVRTVRYNGNESVGNLLIVHESNSMVYHWTGENFKLMYDFNLNAGDTLKTEVLYINFCDSVSPVIIDSVSSLNVNGINLKVQYITYTPYSEEMGSYDPRTERIVERVGSEMDFIYAPNCGFDEHFAYTGLRCYNDVDISYRNEWWDRFHHDVECDSVINANIQEVSDIKFTVYPNPVDDFVIISDDGQYGGAFCAELYNSLGEKLYATTAECSVSFNMDNYQAGLYVIKVYKKEFGIYTFKVSKN
ncbi:MAG: T9SS type A sorting domain-containing protein [Bacteroidales bacterium]|nr:T9SS type A sorting domain-containing protein [Bacteroidales bacterium]